MDYTRESTLRRTTDKEGRLDDQLIPLRMPCESPPLPLTRRALPPLNALDPTAGPPGTPRIPGWPRSPLTSYTSPWLNDPSPAPLYGIGPIRGVPSPPSECLPAPGRCCSWTPRPWPPPTRPPHATPSPWLTSAPSTTPSLRPRPPPPPGGLRFPHNHFPRAQSVLPWGHYRLSSAAGTAAAAAAVRTPPRRRWRMRWPPQASPRLPTIVYARAQGPRSLPWNPAGARPGSDILWFSHGTGLLSTVYFCLISSWTPRKLSTLLPQQSSG